MKEERQPLQSNKPRTPSERESTVIRFRKEPLLAARAAPEGLPSEDAYSRGTDPYKQLLDTIYDAVLVSTVTGHITDANLRSVDFLLYDVAELCQMRITDIFAGSDANLLPTIMESLDRDKYALLEAKCIRKDASRFSAEIAVSRICCDDQTKLFMFIRDLTVRKQAEKALRETLYRLEKQDRARALLVSNVTHELRTPLTSLTYGLSNLLSGVVGPVTPQVRRYLERFDRECQRLLGTVEDILYLEEIEAKALHLCRTKTSANRLLAKSIAALELQARHKGVAVNLNLESGATFAYCDPAKMERVLLNIIGNAIKYTPRGGTVGIALEKHPSRYKTLIINVEDTGVGIPPHAIGRIMDRYYKVGEQADGAGLGLAIAKEITEMHGGSIRIMSPPTGKKHGTLVSIDIPAADPPDVLLLSNEAATTRTVMEQLTSAGYRATAESGSGKTMDHVREKHIDLLIVDLPLPDADGTEMIATVRSDAQGRRISIVVLASTELSAAQREILSCLSIPILNKPWSPNELLDCMAQALVTTGGRVDGKSS